MSGMAGDSEFRVTRKTLVLQAMAIVDYKGKRSVRLLGPKTSRDLTPDEADELAEFLHDKAQAARTREPPAPPVVITG
nr:MAG TPA_asm: API3 pepsin inhibitor-3 [Caudoviricetes sp.]